MRLLTLHCLFAGLVFSTSCGTIIQGLDDGYGAVNKRNRTQIAAFHPDDVLYPAPDSTVLLHEISAADVRSLLGQDSMRATCVVIWVPWCTSERCLPLSYYARLAAAAHRAGAAFLLISDQYDLKGIARQRERFGYAGRIFVMEHALYGRQNRGKQTRQFVSEMVGRPATDSMVYAQCFVFRGDSLAGYGHAGEMMRTPDMQGIAPGL